MQNYKRSHNFLEMGIWIQLIRIRFPHPNELNTKNLNVDFFGGQYLAKSLILAINAISVAKKVNGAMCFVHVDILLSGYVE